MGTSRRGTTRALRADLRQWALFAVWDSRGAYDRFITDSPVLARWSSQATTLDQFLLEPMKADGAWGGSNPFPALESSLALGADDPIAVLTRATVRPSQWWRFQRFVPMADDAMQRADGCELVVGMGEWPIGEQATFSVWRSTDAMTAFAYGSEAHREVVRRTSAQSWYSEQLFCRFRILDRH